MPKIIEKISMKNYVENHKHKKKSACFEAKKNPPQVGDGRA